MISNTGDTLEWLRRLSLEERRVVLAAIEKCGCVCHVAQAMHFRSCCEFTYVKIFDPENIIPVS